MEELGCKKVYDMPLEGGIGHIFFTVSPKTIFWYKD